MWMSDSPQSRQWGALLASAQFLTSESLFPSAPVVPWSNQYWGQTGPCACLTRSQCQLFSLRSCWVQTRLEWRWLVMTKSHSKESPQSPNRPDGFKRRCWNRVSHPRGICLCWQVFTTIAHTRNITTKTVTSPSIQESPETTIPVDPSFGTPAYFRQVMSGRSLE